MRCEVLALDAHEPKRLIRHGFALVVDVRQCVGEAKALLELGPRDEELLWAHDFIGRRRLDVGVVHEFGDVRRDLHNATHGHESEGF